MQHDGFRISGAPTVTMWTKLGVFMAAMVTGASAVLVGATPAHAMTPVEVIQALAGLYETYQKYTSKALTLDQATSNIINAINTAKTEIMEHTDRLATAEVRACAQSAVINIVDLQALSPDSRQSFAQNATECVTKASSLLSVVTAPAQIDELGFALNTAGPIALIARSASGLSTPALQQALVNANNALVSRLSATTSCKATVVAGDSLPGQAKQVSLTCRAYNGDSGETYTVCSCTAGRPLPQWDFSRARTMAMKNTSFALANAVLPVLTA